MNKYGKPSLRQVLKTIDYDNVYLMKSINSVNDDEDTMMCLTNEELKTYADYIVNKIVFKRANGFHKIIELRLHPNKVKYEEVRLWIVKRAF